MSAELARTAYARRAWRDAYTLFAAEEPADAADLERLAVAAYLIGEDAASNSAWERAHLAFIEVGSRERGARCAVWLALTLILQGEMARADGWLSRAERLIGEVGGCAERGLLLVPTFLGLLEGGDFASAKAVATEILTIGREHSDADVLAFGLLTQGEALLALGEPSRGLRLLDEAMVSVTTGEVSPIPAGIVYCAVIEACMIAFELARAAEWTEALHDWCTAEPDLVPYRGQCLVHRSQVLQAHGSWDDAVIEAGRACARLSDPAHPALGLAHYQLGELHRLKGEVEAAAAEYRAASDHGREPAPGMALLRLAEGNVSAARASIRRMLDESIPQLTRPTILAAAVDVLVAAGDIPAARAASDELAGVAAAMDVPLLNAISAYASGSVFLAASEWRPALIELRRACNRWRDLGIPYDVARSRVGMALACRGLGDDDAADLELAAAAATFVELGARPDLARVEALMSAPPAVGSDRLTKRECEVLRLLASGMSNRDIAATLTISEHTVARHVQNIFTKLGLASRSAATAYAFQHGLT